MFILIRYSLIIETKSTKDKNKYSKLTVLLQKKEIYSSITLEKNEISCVFAQNKGITYCAFEK